MLCKPSVAGSNSKNASTDGNVPCNTNNKVSAVLVPQTARTEGEILQSSKLKSYTYGELRIATRNFHPDNVLGEGGFGSVFKGWIDEKSNLSTAVKPGTGIIAVKRLNQDGCQGHREWLAWLNNDSEKKISICFVSSVFFLPVTVSMILRGSFQPLSWSLRLKVALAAAKGLAFLHNAETKVIYRDFKTSNILLDSDYNAKLSDFGLARDGPTGDKSHVTTRIMGTDGYAAPEYRATGHLTTKSDIYSSGVVLWKCYRYSRLEGQYSAVEVYKVTALALRCLLEDPKSRPNMDEVVRTLEQLMYNLQISRTDCPAA
ncbi:hypothetical protein TSUD_110480 [Trifolium subterraneum]|uniref:Protein kinase domain-containing protein n=1 Tax=Trifolium subterraneum TaxID=3900 RepID=A0A2Z6LYE6_TRISU|nr:hypothetical protein TSUD_110480 [Trifolium subterraneum]